MYIAKSFAQIAEFIKLKSTPLVIGIDGASHSGKSSLAGYLCEKFNCLVVHFDNYYPEYDKFQYGVNLDIKRILGEFSSETLIGSDETLMIFEGSYAFHPKLTHLYNLKIFVDVNPEEQRKRVLIREKNNAEAYFSRWIPLEEDYHKKFDVCAKCDVYIDTSKLF